MHVPGPGVLVVGADVRFTARGRKGSVQSMVHYPGSAPSISKRSAGSQE